MKREITIEVLKVMKKGITKKEGSRGSGLKPKGLFQQQQGNIVRAAHTCCQSKTLTLFPTIIILFDRIIILHNFFHILISKVHYSRTKKRWVCKKKRYVIPTSSTWASVLTRSCQLFALPWYARPDHLHSSRTIISNCSS